MADTTNAAKGGTQASKPAKKAPETMLVMITGEVDGGKKKGILEGEVELPVAEAQRLIDLKVAEPVRVSTKAASEPAE